MELLLTRKEGLLMAVLITLLQTIHPTESAPLSSYLVSSFTSPDPTLPFNHLAINNATGDVYIGARERLYQLSSDLTLKKNVTLGPCTGDNENANDNKLLVVAPSPVNRLITCGGCDGYCETRSLEDISDDVTRPDERSTQKVVAIHVGDEGTGDTPTVGTVVLGANITTERLDDALYLFTGVSENGQVVSKRDLAELDFVQGAVSDVNGNAFLQVISYTDFLYYFIDGNRPSDSNIKASVVGRLCPNSLDTAFESYSEIELQCGSHTMIQAAHIGPAGSQLADSLGIGSTDGVLYAVFGDGASPAESALCVYKMSDIQQSFQTAVLGCIRDGDNSGVTIGYLGEVEENCDIRGAPSSYQPPDGYQCTASDGDNVFYRYAAGVTPVQRTPVLTLPSTMVTSIITTQDREHTVAFVGTQDRGLHKILIVNDTFASDYEMIPLEGGSVLLDIFLDGENEELTLATNADSGSQVLKLSMANCSQHKTCDACIGGNGGNDRDPYCGWCTLEARCTRYAECDLPDESTRWLPYNALQCVSISDVQPGNDIPYQETEQQLTITVQQLPSLGDNESYSCAFDSYNVEASTTSNVVTCQTPPENNLPVILPGDDHANVTLSIRSTETGVDFVSTLFTFFDCSLISSCSSCVTSPWPCDWCVYDNKCTHDNTTCQAGETIVIGDNNPVGSGNRGQGFCPQLMGTAEEFLLPVNVPSGYTVLAKNLPTDQTKIQSYECILNVEGEEVAVTTTEFNDSFVVCPDESYSYAENILTSNVTVSVRWNGANYIDQEAYVTLYKCSVNSGSCSRCLSPEATKPRLQCGWCETECNVLQSDVCNTNNFLWQNQTQMCNNPEITDFFPSSGPVEGNTLLEILGTDLGVLFADIIEVSVGDLNCDLNGMEGYYRPGESVSCITAESGTVRSEQISIIVNISSDNRTGISEQSFMYRNPMITGFSPMEGPAAGGTRVTIQGEFLDTGRNITAAIGDYPCDVIDLAENKASCRTTGTPQNEMSEHNLVMIFDTAERTSQDSFQYKPNPQVSSIDRTESIEAGGVNIVIKGSGFELIQDKIIIATDEVTGYNNSERCDGDANTLVCPTPPFPDAPNSRRRRDADDGKVANLTLSMDGFIIDIEEELIYLPDPVYYDFSGPDGIVMITGNFILEINGTNLDSANVDNHDDVRIIAGPDSDCAVLFIEPERLRCKLPDTIPAAGNYNGSLGEGPAMDLPAIVVFHGNLEFSPGYITYETGGNNIGVIAGSVAGVAVLIIIVMMFVGRHLVTRSHKNLDRQAEELELVGKKIQQRVESAFHDLQVDMSEVEEQLKGLGIPFVNTQDYTRNMLFSGLDVLPATADPEYLDADLERAMITFSRQLSNPEFLVSYIQELEVSKKSHRKDRVNIASLITVILISEGKFDYFTQVLQRLLECEIVDAEDGGSSRLRSLFRRTETIIEKLLANWLSLCMYQYLKKQVAKSLYLLYQSIKIQVEKGPIDIITGQSYFSLNFDCLMGEDLEFSEMTLSVAGSNGQHEYYVKVLDIDCITQVKQKILDAAYRRKHYVKQSRAHDLDLLWYHPGGEERILRDQDEYNTPADNSKAVTINMLKAVGVKDNERVALIDRVQDLAERKTSYQPVSPGAQKFYLYDQQGWNDVRVRDYTRIETHQESGSRLCHLVPEEQMQTDENGHKTKLDKEFSAPHLLVTKKTIEPFLNQFMAAIFEKPDDTPVTIKYLFDFYDKMAAKHCPDKPNEYAEAWKSNSLPQHYWVTTLTHPSYIFDMRQSRSADQSVSVLANMLDNACKKVIPEASQDSSLNRVLFLKDMPKYIKTISEYYRKLAHRQAPSHVDLQGEFNRLGQEFTGLYSRVGTLKLLYDFTSRDAGDLLDSVTEVMQSSH